MFPILKQSCSLKKQPFLICLFTLTVLWVASARLCPTDARAAAAPKKILILNSYGPNLPGGIAVNEAMRDTIRRGYHDRVEIYYEFQDNDRIPNQKYEAQMVDFLKHKYADEHLDLIIGFGGPAVDFLLKHEVDLFAGVPRSFYFHDEPQSKVQTLWPRITGVWATIDLTATLDLALRLHSDTNQVVVISGDSPADAYFKQQAQEQFRKYESKILFNYLHDLSMDQLKNQLAALPPHTIVLYLSFILDHKGNTYSGPEALSLFAQSSTAPIYGISQTYMGYGIVGGTLIDFPAIGNHIGEQALRIIKGENPRDLPPQRVANIAMFDWRQLRRWRIDENSLPEGSLIQFRQPTLWQAYKWYIVGLIAALILETLLIGWLLFLRARRRQAEAASRRLAQIAEAERKQLADVVSNVPGIVWEAQVNDTGNGRKTVFISDYVQKMLGYTPEEWMAAPTGFGLSLMPEEDQIESQRMSEAVVASGRDGVSQFRWRAKDGRLVWAETYLNPILNDQGQTVGLRGVTIDITKRKLAEKSLRESEDKNRAILAAIPDLMFLQTRDGVYLDYHAKNPKDLLVDPKMFVGKNMREVLPADLAGQLAQCFERAEESGEPQIVEYMLALEGDDRWFEARIVHTGDNILSVVRDITERKRALDELSQSEERFSKAFRANPQPMSLSTLAEGRYLDVNDSFLAMSGYTRAEVIGRTSLELGVWETPQHRDDFVEQLLKGWLVNRETKFRTKDGRQRLLLSSAERLDIGGEECLLIASSDITERIAAQRALQESQAGLLLAHQAARMGTFEWNIQTGTNIWSKELEEMYGLAPGTFAQTQPAWEKLVHPDDRDRAGAVAQQAIETGLPAEGEWRVMWPDGSIHWIFGRVQVFKDDAGRPLKMSGINIDITDRMQAQQALQESEARFRNMADTAPVMIWVSDENRMCAYVNKQWLDFTGRTFEQEIGVGWIDGLHPDDLDETFKRIEAVNETRLRFEFEFRLKRADGEYRWVLASGTPRFSAEGEFLGFIGSCLDITERKQSEEALRTSRDQLHEIKNQLEAENIYLLEELQQQHAFGEMIGQSAAIKYVLFKISQVAPIDATVLIMGETGTGKELVARAIHDASQRKDRPLIKVNCAALSPTLIESELFGHEKGAFTGAAGRKPGRFELANGGTLLLDEIGEMPLDLQGKLLRVLQEGEFERVGGDQTIKVDVRIIAATNRELRTEVENGRFREDLWYRLNVFPITMPPLRDRRDDIPLLTDHFVTMCARKFGKTITAVAPDSMDALCKYSWPGNIRELANVIERAVINSTGPVLRIREDFSTQASETSATSIKTLEEMEREYITRVLEELDWRIDGPRGVARLLGINPSTLRTRMGKLGIQRPNKRPSVDSADATVIH
jgi:PAS domain S-box-containing protein